MKIGIIGTGSMGTILLESFIDSGRIAAEQLIITNRTKQKAEALQARFQDLNVVEDGMAVVKQADVTFLCVKPLQFPELLRQLAPHCRPEKILISITSPIAVRELEHMVDCKVARAIPSILNRALTGSSLLSFGERCMEEDRRLVTQIMRSISEPLLIDEDITRVSSDIVSCGPAFFSYLVQQFIEGAVRQTKISREDATILATNMLIGMGKLLEEEHFTLPSLQQRVCVPGGITGEGIKVLEEEVGQMFDHLFQQTQEKYAEDKELLSTAFANK
ncbi:late competence protein ComER [Alkalihalobacillus oceani]|uniref:late competence protein ComER n=1 Tax=Halalkalibacter oceani TaxID=1653776 RepID=UPI002041CEDE|nr:late competence protein ComER [Halalkalibacter oceani]MCM3761542.1 late competence protein ComER [Halalkalibacter oceani]